MARILVVEDDLAINDLITMNLQVAGYECDSAFDGAEAIAAIGRQVYDLALLDVMLPENDLCIISRLQVFAAHAAHVFYDHSADLFRFNVPDQLLPGGAFKIAARPAVISVMNAA